MKTIVAEIFCSLRCRLGEGPVWWEDTLYWVDIEGQAVHAVDGEGQNLRSFRVGQRVGALVPWPRRGFLLALQNGIARFDPATGAVTPLADPEAGLPDNRFNDGKCDPQGRFVVGTMACDATPDAGSVYWIDHDLSWEKVHGPTTISNGLAWSADGATLYHIDTPTRRVRAFPYDSGTGKWGAPRVVIAIPEGSGDPDGMTIDAEGNLWIALWEGWGVECWSPCTGERLARIDLPVARATCPTFGGPDLRTLFITTAREWLDDEAETAQPHAGCVFAARPGVAGCRVQPFLGR